jgi:PIN domain nuclease of toxin-antitoxin system
MAATSYLIDTHILIWWLAGDRRLSASALKILDDAGMEIFLSSISLHEYAIKSVNRKMPLTLAQIESVWSELKLQILPFSVRDAHIYQSINLKHKDPFDKALISQAIANDLILITADQQMLRCKSPGLKMIS